jgi:hypothetical protein
MGMSFAFFRCALLPGCKSTWKVRKHTGALESDNHLGNEDKKIVNWFNETFEDMKSRGMPANWRFRGRDHPPL